MTRWIFLLNYLPSLSSLKGQASMSALRFIFSLVFFSVLIRHDAIADSGRLGFICHPKTNDVYEELCFLNYSAEMNPLMRLYHFSLVTAFVLVALWTAMIRYSSFHLRKIRRATDSSEMEHLCREFFKMFLCHVGGEAVVLSVILGLFCYVQKIHFAETYICTLKMAPMVTCRDLHHQVKSIPNILFIGGLAFLLFLCIVIVCQAVCNKESFIKELIVLNSRENKAGTHVIWNDEVAQVPEVSSQDLTDDISLDWKKLGRQLGFSNAHLSNVDHENRCVREKVTAMLNVWRKRVGEVATAEVLGEALKQIERKDLLTKVNMKWIGALLGQLVRGVFPAMGQPPIGGVRFIFSILFLAYCMNQNGIAESGRQGFTCQPGTDDYHKEECFSNYSAEMNPLMRPYFFLLVTAGILVPLWTSMILHSFRYLPNIRKERDRRKRKRLCRKFRKTFLLHVACEAIVLAVILGVFWYTQKIDFPETYNCTPTTKCRDVNHRDKTILNICIVGGMALILSLCIGTVCEVMCYKENFKELLVSSHGD